MLRLLDFKNTILMCDFSWSMGTLQYGCRNTRGRQETVYSISEWGAVKFKRYLPLFYWMLHIFRGGLTMSWHLLHRV